MNGFPLPYRLDRNRNGGGVMIFVRKDILSKLLTKLNFLSDVEGLFVELNFRKSKWLLCGIYHAPAQSDQYFFNCFDKALDSFSNYDNVLLAGDFNAGDDEPCLSNFLCQHDLYNLVKVGTCLQNTVAACSSLSEFHKLVLTVLKTSFEKNKSCQILYMGSGADPEFKFDFDKALLQKLRIVGFLNIHKLP